MGNLFRSQDMDYVQLILQSDACYDAVCELGEWGMVDFKDLNPSVNAFSRTFVKDIRRSEEMERKLRFFATQMEKGGITPNVINLLSYECHLKHAAPSFQEIEELDNKLSQLETDVKEMNENEANLQRNYLELVELQYIVKLTAQYFDEATRRRSVEESVPHEEASLLAHEEGARQGVQLGYVTGVINRDKYAAFERVMWRGTRGNVYMRSVDIEERLKDPATGEMMDKVVFVAFYQGEVLAQKVKRICDGFGATCYPCPESYAERRALAQRVVSSIEELQSVLARTDEFRKKALSDIADNYEEWYVKVRKMKGAFHTMNKFSTDVTSAALIGEGWVPRTDIDTLRDRLTKVTERLGNGVPAIVKIMSTRESPPTYHVTNKFTQGFQVIVDAYGVATYQEVNPALYTIISFPFLFAVMFGDVGHGLLMTMCAAYMVYKEDAMIRDRQKGEILDMIFGGRYIILLMGLFSIWTGAVYNDFFAKNVWLFESGWKLPTGYFDGGYLLNVTGLSYDDNVCPEGCGYTGTPYPLGVDPIWGLSGNKLSFLNSLKMKMSVLLGVIHMGFGVILTNFNYVHHKHYYGIFLEFIPQIIILWGIFGYLCGMIVYKWCNVFPSVELPDGTLQPTDPSLLVTLVNMFLMPGKVDYASKTKLYEAQAQVQMVILIAAGICVPVLFLGKPLWLNMTHGKKKGDYHAVPTDEEGAEHGHGHGHDEEFNFADVFVDHCIHSIEFVLGSVSNTASYLRLWALSLAHAQLAEVLWDMVLKPCFSGNSFMLFFGFGAWAVLSVGVLLLMEGMSAFLHALRLHWVEFNNKFYKGEGYLFMPFNYKDVVEGTTEDI